VRQEDVFDLPARSVHVWSLDLDLERLCLAPLAAALSSDERARARRFVSLLDRERWVAAHGLVRRILSGYLGVFADSLWFERAAGGKPRLAGTRSLRFNLAHAGGRALLAVSHGIELGVDLEEVKDVGELPCLAATCFSRAEQVALAAVSGQERLACFFAAWTRKEAFLKLLGSGLARPLSSFDVSLAPGEPARLLRVAGDPFAPARVALHAFTPAGGFVAALAVERTAVVVHRHGGALSMLLSVA